MNPLSKKLHECGTWIIIIEPRNITLSPWIVPEIFPSGTFAAKFMFSAYICIEHHRMHLYKICDIPQKIVTWTDADDIEDCLDTDFDEPQR